MKSKLTKIINRVNKRHQAGLNDDDAIAAMVQEDLKTKGWSFMPRWDRYELITDEDKFKQTVSRYGYWSKEVREFNDVLQTKGGYDYMTKHKSLTAH